MTALTTDPQRPLAAAAGLTLEPQRAAHADEMFEVLADPAIYTYMDHGPPPSAEHLRQVYARLEARRSPAGDEQWLNWVLRLPSGQAIGTLQATVFEPATAWVAYVVNSRHWGHGHARRALAAMLIELATAYRVRRFLATIDQRNTRSIALVRALGFAQSSAEAAAPHDIPASDVLFERGAG